LLAIAIGENLRDASELKGKKESQV